MTVDIVVEQALRSSGVEAILGPGARAARQTEVGAVHDALEALAAIAAASEEGRLVCLQSGAIAAAATALQVGTAAAVSCVDGAACSNC